jgi:PAS domain S-box-containing protein
VQEQDEFMTDHAVVSVDVNGRITLWSVGAEALFGLSQAAAVGQTLDLIVPRHLRQRHWTGFHRAMQSPQVKDLAADIPVASADGQVRTYPGRLRDGLGEAIGAVAIFTPHGSTGITPFESKDEP